MSSLMVIDFAGQAFFLNGLVDAIAMFGHHIPVVKAVRHEQSGFHFVELMNVISALPKFVVVAVGTVKVLEHSFIANIAVAVFAFLFISRVDEVVEDIDIFTHVATRMTY